MNSSVSVITPVYNCERFIGETIHSVLQQHYPNLEYIVLDDGSTDRTGDVIQSRFKGFPIHYERQTNVGEQRAVNRGLLMAKGDYFMVVNADDPLLPNAIEHLVEYMESHPDILAGYPDWNSINQDGSLKSHQSNGDYDFVRMVAYHKCLPSVGTIVRRKAIDLGILRDESFRYVGDFDYWLRLGLQSEMARVPETLATWRHSSSQVSNERGNLMAGEHVRVIDKFFGLSDITKEVMAIKNTALFWSRVVAAFLARDTMRIHYMKEALSLCARELLSVGTYRALGQHAKYIMER